MTSILLYKFPLLHIYEISVPQFLANDARSDNVTIRITRHYKKVFQAGFQIFPWADKLIILEEDLYVAEDFYSYFNQVTPLLEQDQSLYCASAWNDLSTVKTASNPTVVLRSETMAGLGWVLTKRLFQEIMPKWPAYDEFADWDMWMRLPEQRKGRECLVPEVPRTSHFGTIGAHITAYSQSKYFSQAAFNTKADVQLQGLDRLGPRSYDSLLSDMIVKGKHMDGSAINPCHKDLISPGEVSYVLAQGGRIAHLITPHEEQPSLKPASTEKATV
ncbi:Protein O-linked-mannose beta-1,2-N-acetylglucosaminyltransferase 1 [Halocaridina rubra]|uniref:Alpha-1,3-mannosyl-glycoprotein 2-beta-N-acetylglucosaminyltransferase n=1 Tax=Halocaridina rubra TaxID=373956 RepID=A0AAN8XLX5_HALRR